MIWLFVVLAVIGMTAVLIWLMKITIKAEYRNHGGNNEALIEFSALFGLIHYRVSLPSIRLESDPPSISGKKGGNSGKETAANVSADELLSSLKEIKVIAGRVVNANKILIDFLGQVSVMKFEWSTAVGMGDAALTGIIAGAMWSVKGSIAALADEYMQLRSRPKIMVTPYFQYKVAGTMFTCIVTFRAGKAILAGIRLLRHWKGSKPELVSKATGLIQR